MIHEGLPLEVRHTTNTTKLIYYYSLELTAFLSPEIYLHIVTTFNEIISMCFELK